MGSVSLSLQQIFCPPGTEKLNKSPHLPRQTKTPDKSNMLHNGHWGINPPSKTPPPLSCQAPPLNQQTVQTPPPFEAIPPYILVFHDPPPPKSRIFQ